MRRILLAVLVLLGCVLLGSVLAGCSALHSEPPDPVAPLLGSEWVARDIGGRGVVDTVKSTLRFDAADRVSGHGGCNVFFGPLRQTAGEIQIGPLGATRKACPPAAMDQEVRFLIALQKARRLEQREDGTLALLDANGTALILMSR